MEKEHHQHLQCDGRGILVAAAWNSSVLGMEISAGDPNSTSAHLTDCYFNSNWYPSPMDHSDPFESALSSIVSSPVASAGIGGGLVIRELIGRLGSICNSGEVSPNFNSTPSRYHSPLNSPPENNDHPHGNSQSQFPGSFLHLPSSLPLNTDPDFVDRAARLSVFGPQFGAELGYPSSMLPTPGNLSRQLSSQSLQDKVNTITERTLQGGDSREGSSVSELNPAGQSGGGGRAIPNDAKSRKRKSNAKSKGRPAPNDEVEEGGENDNESQNTKRIKQDHDAKDKDNSNNAVDHNSKAKTGGIDDDVDEKHTKNSSGKESARTEEPPKDYIHVRARRGQATDSHSLAERVRREKISERMKFLQDLVPGCNKVTGKAVVLDEIINYVQSLQRQVEFLSMKLATVNPRLEFNVESLLPKDGFHGSSSSSAPYPSLVSAAQTLALPYSVYNNSPENPFSPSNSFYGNLRSIHQMPDGFNNVADALQVAAAEAQTAFGSDDLHSIVQMGFQRNHGTDETLEGTKAAASSMKVEL